MTGMNLKSLLQLVVSQSTNSLFPTFKHKCHLKECNRYNWSMRAQTRIIPPACLLSPLLVLLQYQTIRTHTLLIQRVIQYKSVNARSKYRTHSQQKNLLNRSTIVINIGKIKSLLIKTSYKTYPVVMEKKVKEMKLILLSERYLSLTTVS